MMNVGRKRSEGFLYSLLLYGSSFLLFLEWILPLEQISDTKNITIFVIYSFYCFFVTALELKWGISILLKGIALFFILHLLYFDAAIFSVPWFDQVITEFAFNIQALLSQDWYYLTSVFRSFLFLLLVWMMSYLLYYWFVQMKRIFLFVLLTFLYLTVLDTFTLYDAGWSVVRTFIISVLVLGMTNLLREVRNGAIQMPSVRKVFLWVIPLIGLVLFAAAIGYAAPKFGPQWPDPVPFIYSANEASGEIGAFDTVKKVGYGEDDSRLGGSFLDDDTPVFVAASEEKHYWKVETKDIYTGKGWEKSADPKYVPIKDGNIDLNTFSDSVETRELETYVALSNMSIGKLLYPYGTKQVSHDENVEVDYFLDENSDAIHTQFYREMDGFDYTIQYDYPSFTIEQMKSTGENDPEEIAEKYTQLPSELPERVGELAESITMEYDNRYDKAKAIERYFRNNGFSYHTQDVAVPGEEEDYVDQFLFDSKVGYCDNFSTSMVVLLRSIDVPARWVKGFTGGEMVKNNGEEADLYQVTNSNAHSWVEVYFPDIGWVPFEPTIGFTNLSDFETGSQFGAEQPEEGYPDEPEIPSEEEEESAFEEEETVSAFNASDGNRGTLGLNWTIILGGIFILGTIALIVYHRRYHFKKRALFTKLNQHVDAIVFHEAYQFLIQLLQHKGHEKTPDSTLREFAQQIDAKYSTDEMGILTNVYERMLYRNEIDDTKTNELTKLYKNLINRIMG